MVTASLTTPAIVTVTALVTDIRMYSVNTCNKTKKLCISLRRRKIHRAYRTEKRKMLVIWNFLASDKQHCNIPSFCFHINMELHHTKLNKKIWDLDSYHEKSQSSTKQHQQTTSCNMPWAVKIIARSEFLPWIQYKRK